MIEFLIFWVLLPVAAGFAIGVAIRYPDSDEMKRWEAERREEVQKMSEASQKEYRQKMRDRFEKAVKLTPHECDGLVFDEASNSWFQCVNDLLEYYEDDCDDEDAVPPEFVWCAKPSHFRRRSAQDLFEDEFEDQYEDCWEAIAKARPDAVAELDAALIKFFDAIAVLHGWDVDYSQVVLIPRTDEESNA